jgi:hypothetical protein
MIELASRARDFAAFGWLGRLDSTARHLQVMNCSPVAGRFDDGMVDLGERGDSLVGSKTWFPGHPYSVSDTLHGLRERSRTSGSRRSREGPARMVVGTAEPCQQQPDSDVTSRLIGVGVLDLSRLDHELPAVWDSGYHSYYDRFRNWHCECSHRHCRLRFARTACSGRMNRLGTW